MDIFELYPWQDTLWSRLRDYGSRLPHALLLHGQPGIGKSHFARHLGAALLCEAVDTNGHPCGTCGSCRWIVRRSHPDFRLVRPEALDVAEGVEDPEDEVAIKTGSDGASDTPRAKKAPSREIRIDQVRAVAETLMLGSHRGGRRVFVIYPMEAMNQFTANALLKMLEEPPPDTIFVLVTGALERVLPTVLSRCRKIPVATPASEPALRWLAAQGVEDAQQSLLEHGGAPLLALNAKQGPESDRQARESLFAALSDPSTLDVLDLAARLAKTDLRLVVGWIQRWVADCTAYRMAQRIRYYPSKEVQISRLASAVGTRQLLEYASVLTREKRVVDHTLNARLYLENLLLRYVSAMRQRESA